jgi:hypothetical protein
MKQPFKYIPSALKLLKIYSLISSVPVSLMYISKMMTVRRVVTAANAQGTPLEYAMVSYAPMVSVIVLFVRSMMALETSVMIATSESIAPEMIPGFIIGTVILPKVLSFDAPKDMAASSIDIGICIKVAVADIVVYGNLLTIQATIMMIMVPEIAIGGLLKDVSIAIPITEPGMIYGNIEIVSIPLLRKFFLLTVRYAINVARIIIPTRDMNPIESVFLRPFKRPLLIAVV